MLISAINKIKFLILLLILTFIFFLISIKSFAQNPKEEYIKIQKDITTHKKKLESAKKVERSLIEELKKTNAELNDIEIQIKQQKIKIKKMQDNILNLQRDIDENKRNFERQNELLKNRLRLLQKTNGGNDALLIIMSGENFSQTLRMLKYLADISMYDYKLINSYKDSLNTLSQKQEKLKSSLSDLKIAEAKLSKIEESLTEKKKERELLLVSVRREKRSYEKMIRDLEESSKRLLEIIQESERKESVKKRKERQKIDETPITSDSGFSSLKGKLPWPVNGTVIIPYGQQIDPIFNLPVFRSGIHIKTSPNSNVKAIYKGKVVFADDFKGYGQLVIISHGDGYYTLYGNLSRIFLKNGAIIKEDTIIGEVGESSTIGANGLYFEIRYKGKPLDPQQWLRKT
jgi:septal ring factor EnvC (AmiA/AmiB activator)